MIPSRQQALDLISSYSTGSNLRKHMLSVEACLKAYAKKLNQPENLWTITGLIHDFDYEKYPDTHPATGLKILQDQGASDEIIAAIAGHVKTGRRESLLAKALYAVDELSGFIIACALMRPEKLDGMTAKSVKKKLKDKSFAAAVDREEIVKSAVDLGVDLDDHITLCVQALQGIQEELGL